MLYVQLSSFIATHMFFVSFSHVIRFIYSRFCVSGASASVYNILTNSSASWIHISSILNTSTNVFDDDEYQSCLFEFHDIDACILFI